MCQIQLITTVHQLLGLMGKLLFLNFFFLSSLLMYNVLLYKKMNYQFLLMVKKIQFFIQQDLNMFIESFPQLFYQMWY